MKQDLSANSHNKPCWAPTLLAMCYLTLGNVFYARKMRVRLPYSSIKDTLCSSECLQWLDLNGSAGKMILLLYPESQDRLSTKASSREAVFGNGVPLSLCHQDIQTFSEERKISAIHMLWWQDATLLCVLSGPDGWLDVMDSWGCLSLYRKCFWDN